MSEVICTKSHEEYEDDFEKDLDWLISEESRSEDQVNQASVYSTVYKQTFCISSFSSLSPPASLWYGKLSLDCCSS